MQLLLLRSGDKGQRLLGGFVVLMGEGRVAQGLVRRCEEMRRREEGVGGLMRDWKAVRGDGFLGDSKLNGGMHVLWMECG